MWVTVKEALPTPRFLNLSQRLLTVQTKVIPVTGTL